MFIESIQISNFRNLIDQDISFSPSTNIIIGNNGQGKSNILEAVSLLLSGKSFRSFNRDHLICYGKAYSLIVGKIDKNELKYSVKIGVTPEKYSVEINNKKTSLGNLGRLFNVVIFSPNSLSIIKEAATERKNLIDDFLESLDSEKFNLLQDFRKTLKQRNKVLKDIAQGEATSASFRLLESTDEIFLPLVTELTWQRIQLLRDLLPLASTALEKVHEKHVDLSVEYLVSEHNIYANDRDAVEKLLVSRKEKLRDAEIRCGGSLFGPQRHDLRFLFNGKDSRFFCSQGQQRTIILALKMAQIVYHKQIKGIYPILVLDDVLSELDETKSEALISFVQDLGTQIFISSTDVSLPKSFSNNNLLVAEVENGEIRHLRG